ncbi:hypothetical protein QQS21_004873 [Conoideocrella luteorostrata]|uniref:NB-ARC domain-containing protein n=1 Tax=Conoideocrella luteorostrata TaxID=1105319 RepID=A0AAJ0CQG6_9HYPO|nr:hypothetical protein QQS21_004873 [Conoideocrella luteorostrata]
MEQPLDSAHPYAQQCKAAILRCSQGHEHEDLRYLGVKRSYMDVKREVNALREEAEPEILNSLSIIEFSLNGFERLEIFLANGLPKDIDTKVLWTMMSLLIHVWKTCHFSINPSPLQSQYLADTMEASARESNVISSIARSFKSLCHKIDLFNTYCTKEPKLHRLYEAAIDIFVEVITFECATIHFLRFTTEFERTNENSWDRYHAAYQSATDNIEEVLQRSEKYARFSSHVDELQRLQILLSLNANSGDKANLPCSNLPVARSSRFYDRENIIDQIHTHFNSTVDGRDIRSLALHGLGGVGKSYVALKYAHTMSSEYSAVLWIHGETAASLAQSFSEIASRLKLPGAEPQRHDENRILVLDWLQKTSASWLLIYDNVEKLDLLLRYWPVAEQGCVLITTRNHMFAFEPADTGIEILPFDRETGSRFIIHLLSRDIATDIDSSDLESALELSDKLSGHALAITQMAGLIHRRSWSIEEFLETYNRNTRQMLGAPGRNSMDTVWRLSFGSLNSDGANLLGIMCYLTPDTIPQALFEQFDAEDVFPQLRFCSHELFLSDVIDDLMTLALIKREKSNRALSLHRLVQAQFRYFVSPSDNQRFFDQTTYLLFQAFPQSGAKKGQLYDRWDECQLYLQHVQSLKNQYKESLGTPDPLLPSLRFCRLLKSLSRFLLESASYLEVEDVLEVARSALERLQPDENDKELYADLCASSGLVSAHRGLFTLSRRWQEHAHKIRSEADPLDRLELSWTEVNMGNLDASTNRNQDSLDWQIKALRNRQMAGGDDYAVMKPQGLLYQNLARSKYLTGNLQEAHIWCHIAIGVLSDSQNWAMLA